MPSDVNGVTSVGIIGGGLKMILVTLKQMNPASPCLSQGTGERESGGTGSDYGNVKTQSGIHRGALQKSKGINLNSSRKF
jgi:hypothetical protein